MANSKRSEGVNSSVEKRLADIRDIMKKDGLVEAERAMIELLRDEPGSSKAFSALARILGRQKRFDEAARAAEKAKTLGPLEIDPLLMLGFVHLRAKDHAKAGSAFAEALSLDDSNTRALLGAAIVKMAEENYDEAEALCARALEQNPSMDRAQELMARIAVRKGEKDAAIDQLKTLATRSPANSRATKALVRLMNAEDRKAELMQFLKDDLAADPDNKQRVARVARVAMRMGEGQVAIDQLRRVADSDKARITDRIRLIAALIQNGDLDEAEAMTAKLGDAKAMAPVIEKIRGDIALKAGDAKTALTKYRMAVRKAKAPSLDAAKEAEAGSDEEKAKLWKAHSRRKIIEAIRDFRAERA